MRVIESDKGIDALEMNGRPGFAQDPRLAPADGQGPARSHRGDQDLGRHRAHRRLRQEHRQAHPAAQNQQAPPEAARGSIPRMGELAIKLINAVLSAYANDDAEGLIAAWRSDESIDEMYNSLFRELLTYMMEDPRNIGASHPSAVHRQEHRTYRRPRHQHRRNGAFPGPWQAHRRDAPQGRYDQCCDQWLNDRAGPTRPAASTATDGRAKPVVLVVEDEPALADLAQIQPRSRRLPGGRSHEWRGSPGEGAGRNPRPHPPRLDAAAGFGHRGLAARSAARRI